jgi:hypothetical protein
MRLAQYVLAGALALALPASALAQSTYNDHWLASGFVGSTFNQSSDENLSIRDQSSVEFGGQIAYLWAGKIGAEFLADFSPSFKVNSLLIADDPFSNTSMFNVIAVAPFGSDWKVQPYVSGGIGIIHMSADVLNNPLLVNGDTTNGSARRMASDLGGGLMWFGGTVGVRGDIRYFRTSTDDGVNTDPVADRVASSFIDNLSFWRANIGVAFRW